MFQQNLNVGFLGLPSFLIIDRSSQLLW